MTLLSDWLLASAVPGLVALAALHKDVVASVLCVLACTCAFGFAVATFGLADTTALLSTGTMRLLFFTALPWIVFFLSRRQPRRTPPHPARRAMFIILAAATLTLQLPFSPLPAAEIIVGGCALVLLFLESQSRPLVLISLVVSSACQIALKYAACSRPAFFVIYILYLLWILVIARFVK